MACSTQCYVNVCSSYVAPNEVWNYNGSGFSVTPGCASNVSFPVSSGYTVYDENMDRLAGSINDERIRRGISAYSFDNITGSNEGTGTIIYGLNSSNQERMLEIKNSINGISSGYVTYSIIDGTPLTWAQISEAKNKINALRATCICHSDCGGHLVCGCYGDCGCNYSDKRLKKNIRLL